MLDGRHLEDKQRRCAGTTGTRRRYRSARPRTIISAPPRTLLRDIMFVSSRHDNINRHRRRQVCFSKRKHRGSEMWRGCRLARYQLSVVARRSLAYLALLCLRYLCRPPLPPLPFLPPPARALLPLSAPSGSAQAATGSPTFFINTSSLRWRLHASGRYIPLSSVTVRNVSILYTRWRTHHAA
jgi:hypothetical protein